MCGISAFIAVGSNIRPEYHVLRAMRLLQQHCWVRASSVFYWTVPVDHRPDHEYLNGVWHIAAEYDPRELQQAVLRSIEAQLGRVRQPDRFCARTIDLDLIYVEQAQDKYPEWLFPASEILQRVFVCVPLAELAPALLLPGQDQRISTIAAGMRADGMRENVGITAALRRLLNKQA